MVGNLSVLVPDCGAETDAGIPIRESLGESPTTFDSRAEAIADAERRVRELNLRK